MASVRIRFAALHVNNKKMAELEEVEAEIQSGDEEQIGTEGFLTYSDGATVTKVTAKSLIPVSGTTPDVLQALLKKSDVQLALPVFGTILKLDPARMLNIHVTSTSKTGKTSGTFVWGAGKPNV